MSDVVVRLNLDPRRLESQGRRVLRPAMRAVLRQIEAEAKNRTPVLTGNLRRSIKRSPVETTGMVMRGTVTATADYAAAVHDGTRPHVIRPRVDTVFGPHQQGAPSALRFTIGGRTLFRKMVQHPGTKPRPFLRDAAEEVVRRL